MSPKDRQPGDRPTKKGKTAATQRRCNVILPQHVAQHAQQASRQQQDPVLDSQEPQMQFMPTPPAGCRIYPGMGFTSPYIPFGPSSSSPSPVPSPTPIADHTPSPTPAAAATPSPTPEAAAPSPTSAAATLDEGGSPSQQPPTDEEMSDARPMRRRGKEVRPIEYAPDGRPFIKPEGRG